MRIVKQFISLFFIITILAGCEYDYIEPIVNGSTNDTIPVSFATDIQPIFNADCTGCHPGAHALDLTSANSYNQLWTAGPNAPYVDTVNATSSSLYQKINNGSMAVNISSPNDKILILTWIEQGAKNN